jgi:hypothetical protein
LFLLVFFLFMYQKNTLLALVLLDVMGAIFAVLITLYLASLFTWKVTFLFAVLLTIMDFVLVLVTRTTPQAANTLAGLGLPVWIVLPVIPPIAVTGGILGLQPTALGLGDFFFAGTLASQTYKKYGRKIAIISAMTMTISFGIIDGVLFNTKFDYFPGTLMIIIGWLPVVAWKLVSERKTKSNVSVESKV